MQRDAQLRPGSVGPESMNRNQFRQLLQAVRRDSLSELAVTERLGDDQRASRMILLLYLEMLPRNSAAIVRAKDERDRALHPLRAAFLLKLSVWTLILLLNVAAFGTTFYFTLDLSNERQTLWLRCFVFWLFFEPLLADSFFVMAVHLFLPSLAVADLTRARTRLYELIESFFRAARRRDRKSDQKAVAEQRLHFVRLLAVSSRVAASFPGLRESKIVHSLQACEAVLESVFPPLEGEVFEEDGEYFVEVPVRSRFHWLFLAARFLANCCLAVLSLFLSCSVYVQDVLAYCLATVLAGAFCLLYWYVYTVNPVFIMIPLVASFVLFVWVLVQNVKRKIASVESSPDLSAFMSEEHLVVSDLLDTTSNEFRKRGYFLSEGAQQFAESQDGAEQEEAQEEKDPDLSSSDLLTPLRVLPLAELPDPRSADELLKAKNRRSSFAVGSNTPVLDVALEEGQELAFTRTGRSFIRRSSTIRPSVSAAVAVAEESLASTTAAADEPTTLEKTDEPKGPLPSDDSVVDADIASAVAAATSALFPDLVQPDHEEAAKPAVASSRRTVRSTFSQRSYQQRPSMLSRRLDSAKTREQEEADFESAASPSRKMAFGFGEEQPVESSKPKAVPSPRQEAQSLELQDADEDLEVLDLDSAPATRIPAAAAPSWSVRHTGTIVGKKAIALSDSDEDKSDTSGSSSDNDFSKLALSQKRGIIGSQKLATVTVQTPRMSVMRGSAAASGKTHFGAFGGEDQPSSEQKVPSILRGSMMQAHTSFSAGTRLPIQIPPMEADQSAGSLMSPLSNPMTPANRLQPLDISSSKTRASVLTPLGSSKVQQIDVLKSPRTDRATFMKGLVPGVVSQKVQQQQRSSKNSPKHNLLSSSSGSDQSRSSSSSDSSSSGSGSGSGTGSGSDEHHAGGGSGGSSSENEVDSEDSSSDSEH